VIDLSKEALGSEGFTYIICYKTGDYAYRKTYEVSGASCAGPKVIRRILKGNLSAEDSEFNSFANHIGCTQGYQSLLRHWIEELLSGEVDEGCTTRLFSAGVGSN
jgi:hypothetical protein